MQPIREYAELQDRLASLPPLAPGKVRVFRGQTERHPTMLATGYRGEPLHRRMLWRAYTKLLADALRGTGANNRLAIEEWLFWLDAIVQHYGPGTKFLDVTRAVDIALWFALHRLRPIFYASAIGREGDDTEDVALDQTFYGYSPLLEDPGWLYVFDVTPWDRQRSPVHGMLLDLADAPPVFASSRRIKAQTACLLVADDEHGGDLAGCVVGEPIGVRWPLSGCAKVLEPPEEMFPLPTEDMWYRAFLSTPAVLRAEVAPKADGKPCFAQPTEIRPYLPAASAQVRQLALVPTLSPPLLYRHLRNQTRAKKVFTLESGGTRAHLREATPILVEGPLMKLMPSPEGGQWNEELVSTDLADSSEGYDLLTKASLGPLSLQNVFVEYSPLESVTLPFADLSSTTSDATVIRALWLCRFSSEMQAVVFLLDASKRELPIGPIRIGFDRKSRRLKWGFFEELTESVVQNPEIARALFGTLTLLRDLNPRLKPGAYPLMSSGDTAMIRIAGKMCHLVRGPGTGEYWVVRGPGLRQPYIGPGAFGFKAGRATISLTLTATYGHVSRADLMADIEQFEPHEHIEPEPDKR